MSSPARTAPPTFADRVRTATASPADWADVAQAGRILVVILAVATALGVQMWSATQVREAAAQLSATRALVQQAERRHDRLLLERAMLRQPDALRAHADASGLTYPVAVHELAGGPRP